MTSPPSSPTTQENLKALTDDALVARAKTGEFASFEELVGRHEERVYRLAMRLVRNETDAQEVVQETLLSAWRNLPRFEGKSQFGSWVYRIAANAALMLLRSRRRHPQVSFDEVGEQALEEAPPEQASGFGAGVDWSRRPDEQLQSSELRRHIQAAVDALPDSTRTVFLLRDVDGLSTEETAEALDITVPTVKTRLHRARLALRRTISEYFARH